jgi:hypothetical protein
MFVVTEADAAAIRAVFEQRGGLSAAVELGRADLDVLNSILSWRSWSSGVPLIGRATYRARSGADTAAWLTA